MSIECLSVNAKEGALLIDSPTVEPSLCGASLECGSGSTKLSIDASRGRMPEVMVEGMEDDVADAVRRDTGAPI